MSEEIPLRRKNGQFGGKVFNNSRQNLTKSVVVVNEMSCPNETLLPSQENDSNSTLAWRDGRRVVELGLLADQLKACKNCYSPLYLHNCSKEQRYGLGSILYIPCGSCPYTNLINTGKRHRSETSKKGMLIWDVNTKCSLAYLDAGMGPHQTVNFLAGINIPPIAVKNLKIREREIGKTIEKCAEMSCQKALQEEIDLSRDEDDNLNGPSITVSFDGAWQKRGSGRSYSSLTGHATMIGEKTGKCVSQGTKSADCRKCMYVDEKGDGQHDCRKNHSGSAKSMEPNLAVEMVQDLQCKGCTVSCIIMDDDTTTLARLKQNINSDIVKRSDKNHQRKNIVSDLYRLHEKHKGKLSTSTISYLTKDLDYAIAQNQNHAEQLSQNIYAIIPHSFGDHSHCDLSWCNYHKDPENYKHKSLPYGKDLNGEEMFADLSKLFDSYAKNSHKLANCGSSQGNESLNQIIALKAPKAKHFGSSQSLPFRVCVGVIQKNEGRSYIPQVYEAHNLSPGKFTVMHTAKIDKKRKHDKVNASTREAKRKRLVKKGKFNINLKAKEIREGITYATSISAPGNSIEKADDISPIPDPEPEVTEDPVSLKDETFVYFDLETTGFGTDCDIIQLAAAYANQNYNRYMVPSQRISPSASKVTGFSKSGLILYKNGEIMQTDEEPEIFKQFISWLPKKCILIGHNSKIFDSRILTKALQNNNVMKDFELKCVGFIDTLSLTKELLPDRKTSKQSYNQESLVKDIVGISYDAHNAIGDVQSLQQLINTLKVSPRMLEKHSFSVRYTVNMISKLQLTKSRLESFNNIPSSFCSKTMLNKIAKSGLRLNHLILAGNRGGVDGIRELLTEQIDGKPRVTKDKKILDSISEHIMSLQN
ncbi:uncharacterized protein LOC134722744 [Mytilus trossulus]|uniref:uncharacterized protein LOC134695243 n=1 Tax=Mytilus trossulus TaxID=6551 RepID=UPI003006F1C1